MNKELLERFQNIISSRELVAAGFSLRKWRNLKVAATKIVDTLFRNRSTMNYQRTTLTDTLQAGCLLLSFSPLGLL
jgi:hypothetical protein